MSSAETLTNSTHPERLDTSNEAIYLRLTNVNDANELSELVTRERSFLQEFQPWALDYTPEDAPAKVADVVKKIEAGEWLQYRIVQKDDDAMIGTVTLYDHDPAAKTAKRGIWLAEAEQGKGYARATAISLMDYAFEAWDLRSITSEIDERNTRAQAYAQKLGAVPSNETYVSSGDNQRFRVWSIARER